MKNYRLTVAINAFFLVLCFSSCSLSKVSPIKVKPVSTNTVEQKHTNPWILIDSQSKRLILFRNDKEELTFNRIAFGAAGVRQKQQLGDDVTPLGLYKVGWISQKSKFFHFIGLNYPNLIDAQRGLDKGKIDRKTYNTIVLAHSKGKIPPQDTSLGGMIGIHGIGKGDLDIHRIANWTAGCIALENEQVHKLALSIKPGITVEIR